MNTNETNIVVRELVRAYPVWNPAERQALLREKLLPQDFERALKGVNNLIETFKGLPSIADVLEAIRTTQISRQVTECPRCDNLGWLLIDLEGQSTYRQCSCGNQNAKRQINDNLTTDGKQPASLAEGIAAFKRGMTAERPDLSPEYIQEQIDILFPKQKAF